MKQKFLLFLIIFFFISNLNGLTQKPDRNSGFFIIGNRTFDLKECLIINKSITNSANFEIFFFSKLDTLNSELLLILFLKSKLTPELFDGTYKYTSNSFANEMYARNQKPMTFKPSIMCNKEKINIENCEISIKKKGNDIQFLFNLMSEKYKVLKGKS